MLRRKKTPFGCAGINPFEVLVGKWGVKGEGEQQEA